MRMFFMRYRRNISFVIVILVAIFFTRIYLDMTKSWSDKVLDSEEMIEYGDKKINFEDYKAILNLLDNNQKLEYYIIQINKNNSILIKYLDDKKTKYSIINKMSGKAKIYNIDNDIDLNSLKEDGIFKFAENQYASLDYINGKIEINLVFYESSGLYYYNKNEISKEEYDLRLKDHLEKTGIYFRVLR